ncbi:unnamed protein product [Linum trigynum]|uniref:Uncharacterized protein n=1 Tax=Linum trigynum TaxID=586398 RepID=A0AAV2EEL5_9ROSI
MCNQFSFNASFLVEKQIWHPWWDIVFDLMALRQRQQEDDISLGFVMKQVANFKLGQNTKGVAGNNGMTENLPLAAQSVDYTTNLMLVHQMLEENRKMIAENRQVMGENRRCMEDALAGTHKVLPQNGEDPTPGNLLSLSLQWSKYPATTREFVVSSSSSTPPPPST